MISTLLKSATTIAGSALRCILACHVSLHAAWSFAWQVRQLSEPTNWLPLMPSIAVAGPTIAVGNVDGCPLSAAKVPGVQPRSDNESNTTDPNRLHMRSP